nr:uncharacterized protein CTRU02_02027 [Colletotrichum truncatum]KAF6799156.1 hypothetical protein CTRU02_02027 [Colletotrichum truncatum]
MSQATRQYVQDPAECGYPMYFFDTSNNATFWHTDDFLTTGYYEHLALDFDLLQDINQDTFIDENVGGVFSRKFGDSPTDAGKSHDIVDAESPLDSQEFLAPRQEEPGIQQQAETNCGGLLTVSNDCFSRILLFSDIFELQCSDPTTISTTM